jgi:hypothetical protein
MSKIPDFHVFGVIDGRGNLCRTVCDDPSDTICLDGYYGDGKVWHFESDAYHLASFAKEKGFEHYHREHWWADLEGPAKPRYHPRPITELGKQEAERRDREDAEAFTRIVMEKIHQPTPEPFNRDVAHESDIEFCKEAIASLSEQLQNLSTRLDRVYRRGL